MFKNILKWGAISGFIMLVIFYASYLIFPPSNPDLYTESEIMGYVGILMGVVVIYFAIANHFQGQAATSSLWSKILFGLAVAFVSGSILGLYNLFYMSYIDPTFMDDYLAYSISQLPTQSGAEYDKMVTELTQQMEAFSGPIAGFLMMAIQVWIMAIPASIISALIHNKVSK